MSLSLNLQPRGLQNFIQELRACANPEAERTRVEKELANIREKFSNSANLSSYQRKKYVWKLVYIHMLGYTVDFGHMEMISLLCSNQHPEKAVGYMAVSLILGPNSELMTLVVNSIRGDLISPNPNFQALALAAISNLGNEDLVVAVSSDVIHVLSNKSTPPDIRKKALLCLLRLYRASPECVELTEWPDRLATVLDDRNLGVLISGMSLLLAFTASSSSDFAGLVPYAIHILHRLVVDSKEISHDYKYYSTPTPWLQVKCLRYLQYYGPVTDEGQAARLNELLRKIITKTDASDSANKTNADHSVLIEALYLVISYGEAAETKLRQQALSLLGYFIGVKDGNIRYLGLEAMARLARKEGPSAIQVHQETVFISLKDADISVKRRALDVIFLMCTSEHVAAIVAELLSNLTLVEVAVREEMVLKIAIMAEKYAPDLQWYIDTIMKVIALAGECVSDEIWYRVVQIVVNNPDLHKYACSVLFDVLQSRRCHETAVCLGAYLLGEYGYLIAQETGRSGEAQFEAISFHFSRVSDKCRGLLLMAYGKLSNLYPEVSRLTSPVLDKFCQAINTELQQRACELTRLHTLGPDKMEEILKEMPKYNTEKESMLETRLREATDVGTDKSAFQVEATQATSDGSGGGDKLPELEVSSHVAVAAAAGRAGGDLSVAANIRPGGEGQLLAFDDNTSKPNNNSSIMDDNHVEERVTITITPDMIPKLRSDFNRAVVTSQCVLFESDVLQVGIKHDYHGAAGKLALFFANKSSSQITNFSVEFNEIPYLTINTQPPAISLAVGEQTRLLMSMECQAPFADAPQFVVSFDCKISRYVYKLRLPIVASSFMEPVVLGQEDYMNRWRALTGEDREAQEIINVTEDVDAAMISKLRSTMTSGMHFGLGAGLDTSDMSITAASTFRTNAKSADGNPVSVGCLVRVEANAAMKAIRVTARAVHPKIALAIKNLIRAQIV